MQQTNSQNEKGNAGQNSATVQLSHGQLVRVAGFRNFCDIIIGTIAGYEKENVLKYSPDKSETAIEEAQKEGLARAIKFGHSLAPWANQSPAVLTDNYPGKMEKLAKEEAARAAAPMLTNGQIVEVEGKRYAVRVVGENYSDPIHFKAI